MSSDKRRDLVNRLRGRKIVDASRGYTRGPTEEESQAADAMEQLERELAEAHERSEWFRKMYDATITEFRRLTPSAVRQIDAKADELGWVKFTCPACNEDLAVGRESLTPSAKTLRPGDNDQ